MRTQNGYKMALKIGMCQDEYHNCPGLPFRSFLDPFQNHGNMEIFFCNFQEKTNFWQKDDLFMKYANMLKRQSFHQSTANL